MCTKTMSENVITVGVAIVMTVISLATMELARAVEETCEYSIDNMATPRGDRTLLATERLFLQTPIDINASRSTLSAARLRFQDPPSEKHYLRVYFYPVEFVETEEKARSRVNLGRISGPMPLVLQLADGSTITLNSWDENWNSSRSKIHRPSEWRNSTDFIRITHTVGSSYWLDDDQLAILLEQPATKLQVTTTQGDFNFTIHPSLTDRIQFVLGCLYSHDSLGV